MPALTRYGVQLGYNFNASLIPSNPPADSVDPHADKQVGLSPLRSSSLAP